eukprot:1144453-Pyramimonas_sp.AAC.1
MLDGASNLHDLAVDALVPREAETKVHGVARHRQGQISSRRDRRRVIWDVLDQVVRQGSVPDRPEAMVDPAPRIALNVKLARDRAVRHPEHGLDVARRHAPLARDRARGRPGGRHRRGAAASARTPASHQPMPLTITSCTSNAAGRAPPRSPRGAGWPTL